MQETKIYQKQNQDVKLHEPNLCVLSTRYNHCINESKLYFCLKCGYRTKVLKTNVISGFVDYIFGLAKYFKRVTVLAHNGQSFDHQFILNELLIKSKL